MSTQDLTTFCKSRQSYSMPFDFDINNELPFSCPECPEKKYKFFMGLSNHYIRKHFNHKEQA